MSYIPVLAISGDELAELSKPGLDHRKSEILCRLAIASYSTTRDFIKTAIGPQWSGLVTWTDERLRAQGFLAWADRVAVLSFRGTDSNADWRANIGAFWPDPHPLGGRRHNGFQAVWEELRTEVLDLLTSKIGLNSQLWITGHSLGGAMATAAAAEFLLDRPAMVADTFGVMTIGAPRYGNAAFVEAYDAGMRHRHWFYANEADPVTHLPLSGQGYRHCGSLKYFRRDGEFVEVTKEDVGLQSAAGTAAERSRESWRAIEHGFWRQADSPSNYERLVERVVPRSSAPVLKQTADGMSIEVLEGQLQGDDLWSAREHNSGLYWRRIATVAART